MASLNRKLNTKLEWKTTKATKPKLISMYQVSNKEKSELELKGCPTASEGGGLLPPLLPPLKFTHGFKSRLVHKKNKKRNQKLTNKPTNKKQKTHQRT